MNSSQPGAILVPGQKNRRQRREEARQIVANMDQFLEELTEVLSWHEYRMDCAYEALRLMGANEEIFTQAQENVNARRKILANKIQTIPEVPEIKS